MDQQLSIVINNQFYMQTTSEYYCAFCREVNTTFVDITSTAARKSKAVPGWGGYFPRFIYSDLRLNVIPPIPALSREPAEVSSARERSARGFLV